MALVPSPEAPYVARRTLETLAGELDASAMEDARVVLSELVSNAVTHGAVDGGRTGIAAWLSRTLLLIEVEDRGPGFDPPAEPAADARSGWGLRIVDRLVERWGVTSGPGTTVWCELARGAVG
jgi:anti-sigma regulatory factor (Ser/Thr protein kinase)